MILTSAVHVSRPAAASFLGGLAALASAVAMSQTASSPPASSPQAACSALQGMQIPASAIGLPTSGALVQSAALVAADAPENRNGEHCQVKGAIRPRSAGAPDIEFQVNLPTEWNGKAVHYGGGGYNGVVVTGLNPASMHPTDIPTPLRRGYITLGSDSGHKNTDPDWALNEEALANFGHQQLKKVHDVAVALARQRYGRAPARFYFIGSSQGGHEALDVAVRYSADYDGVVATHPAYNVPMLHLGSLNVVQAGAANNGAGWLNPAKHTLVKNRVMEACDSLDGTKDGIISHIPACRRTMTVARLRSELRCPDGRDGGDTCLSDAQLRAVERIVSPYRPGVTIAGADEFAGWGMLEGADLPLGTRPIPSNPPTTADSFFAVIAATTIKYAVTRDPGFDIVRFDPRQYRARLQEVGKIMDVTDGDLTAFKQKGGKIIMTHGTTDQLIPYGNSEAYYARQKAKFGAELDSFLRFYVIPGFAHGGGTFTARYDALTQLENWVEKGTPPQGFVTVDENPATKGRTRPMCLYGTYPKFTGAANASLNDAAHYECVAH